MDPALTRASWAPDQAPETILYAFKGMPDGQYPGGQLIEDQDGSLYGTTVLGGLANISAGGQGTVFKLTRKGRGFAESVLYRFGASGPTDGIQPIGGNALAMDRRGALYGVTNQGGYEGNAACAYVGCGIVYKLTPTPNGYAETILHSFDGADGNGPVSNPILDQSGALYGTTWLGQPVGSPSYYSGVVYKLTPTRSGYSFSILHQFGTSGENDGQKPWGPLLRDEKTGDLYGTTISGGSYQAGTVFRLRPTASGYSYKIIYTFNGVDEAYPEAGLIMDSTGAFYGTTTQGGPSSSLCVYNSGSCGVVFKLTPTSGGYKVSVLHYFNGADGYYPTASLVADRCGNLYSTTSSGGKYSGGNVFELVRTPSRYREVTLHDFNPNTDGAGGGNGLLLEGNYLLGETLGTVGGPNGPNINGNIFALKIH
jgi:uncharacterized repeat protein (TIGR03803 family)